MVAMKGRLWAQQRGPRKALQKEHWKDQRRGQWLAVQMEFSTVHWTVDLKALQREL